MINTGLLYVRMVRSSGCIRGMLLFCLCDLCVWIKQPPGQKGDRIYNFRSGMLNAKIAEAGAEGAIIRYAQAPVRGLPADH